MQNKPYIMFMLCYDYVKIYVVECSENTLGRVDSGRVDPGPS